MDENSNELVDFSNAHPFTLEDMSLPCPHDICDGSGELEDEQKCLCVTELDEDQYDADRDY